VAADLLQRTQREGSAFDLGVPEQVIASRLSVQPEALSPTMRSLGDFGVIQVEGARVEVLDRRALEAACGREPPGE
jgi:hypothetical protein